MKLLLLLTAAATAATGTGLVHTGLLPCPCELVEAFRAQETAGELGPAVTTVSGTTASATEGEAPAGLYLEARDATVWGGACHISAEADNGGSHAAMGWAFESGRVDGVELSGVRVVAVLQGSGNLWAHELFRTGEPAQRRSMVWIDAPTEEAGAAALTYVRGIAELGSVSAVEQASVEVARVGDQFTLAVPGVLEVEGEAIADRSCCTMPESRWYPPLSDSTGSVVGVPRRCRFDGKAAGLGSWTFEDGNSAYVARFGA